MYFFDSAFSQPFRNLHLTLSKGDVLRPSETRELPEQGMPIAGKYKQFGSLIIGFSILFPATIKDGDVEGMGLRCLFFYYLFFFFVLLPPPSLLVLLLLLALLLLLLLFLFLLLLLCNVSVFFFTSCLF
jgi:hypothetical protein